MIEHQMETLVCRIETLESETQLTNNLLMDILVEIRANGSPPAPALAVAVESPECEIEAVAAPDPIPEPQGTPRAPVSLSDARDALIACAETCGGDTARGIVAQFATKGLKPTLGSVPPEDFQAVLNAACEAILHKEAS